MKSATFLLIFCAAFLLHSTNAEAARGPVESVLFKTANRIYIISESKGTDIAAYENALKSGAKSVREILNDPNYKIEQEQYKGLLAFHTAAKLGLYEIVKVLLEDERYVVWINSTGDKSVLKLLPLDRARIRSRVVKLFLNPTHKHNIFSTVPFYVTQGFYNGQLKPYQKTIALLESRGAKRSCELRKCYKANMLLLLDRLDAELEKPDLPQDAKNKMMVSRIDLQKNLSFLEDNSNLSDEDLIQKISSNLLKDFLQRAEPNTQ